MDTTHRAGMTRRQLLQSGLAAGVAAALASRAHAQTPAGTLLTKPIPVSGQRLPVIGIGYGLTFFAASILLLDYFGRGPYLELFATVNLISTVGAVAPTLAGLARDRLGAFAPFFVVLAGLVALVTLAVAMMRPPHRTVP